MLPLERFIQKWCHPEYPPLKASEKAMRETEARFDIRFPKDYCDQVERFGFPSPTRSLLSAISAEGLELPDLSELISATEIFEETVDWREIGMPVSLIVIGVDSGGSKFCFDQSELSNVQQDQGSIYFWDHDFGTTKKVSDSFSGWIELYLGTWSQKVSFSDF